MAAPNAPKPGLTLSAFKKPSIRLTKEDDRTIESLYDLGGIIGHGGTSLVRAAIRRSTGEMFAAKIIMKHELLRERRLLGELLLLRKLKHPNIVSLHDIFETDSEIYLVMEYCAGGELFDRVVEKKTYSERDASEIIFKLLQALEYLHSKGIIHRDVKPENVLLAGKSDDVDVKLSDFGLARILKPNAGSMSTSSSGLAFGSSGSMQGGLSQSNSETCMQQGLENMRDPSTDLDATKMELKFSPQPSPDLHFYTQQLNGGGGGGASMSGGGVTGTSPAGRDRLRSRAYTRVGSDYYTAPEVEFGAGYGTAVDIWSLGVVAYILLCGFPPFADGEYSDVQFPDSHWQDISVSGKDLIRSLLLLDDKQRPSATEALAHEWITGRSKSASLAPLPLEEMQRFVKTKRRFSQMEPGTSYGSLGGGSRSPMLIQFDRRDIGGVGSIRDSLPAGQGASTSAGNLGHITKRIHGLNVHESTILEEEERERRSSMMSNSADRPISMGRPLSSTHRRGSRGMLSDVLKNAQTEGELGGGVAGYSAGGGDVREEGGAGGTGSGGYEDRGEVFRETVPVQEGGVGGVTAERGFLTTTEAWAIRNDEAAGRSRLDSPSLEEQFRLTSIDGQASASFTTNYETLQKATAGAEQGKNAEGGGGEARGGRGETRKSSRLFDKVFGR